MPFWTYMLRCSNGRYYTGQTDDLEQRLGRHQAGTFGGYTARFRPVELIWSAQFDTRLEALEAERIVGGWSRAKKEAMICGEWDAVSFFAKPPRERQRRFSTTLETNAGEASTSTHPAFASSEVQKPHASNSPSSNNHPAP